MQNTTSSWRRRRKTPSPVIRTQVRNTRRKLGTALKKRTTTTTCQSEIPTRTSTGRWDLVTTKKKKAVGRSRSVIRESGRSPAVGADRASVMATTGTGTRPGTRLIPAREKGAGRETEAEVPRNLKKNLSTGERWRIQNECRNSTVKADVRLCVKAGEDSAGCFSSLR